MNKQVENTFLDATTFRPDTTSSCPFNLKGIIR